MYDRLNSWISLWILRFYLSLSVGCIILGSYGWTLGVSLSPHSAPVYDQWVRQTGPPVGQYESLRGLVQGIVGKCVRAMWCLSLCKEEGNRFEDTVLNLICILKKKRAFYLIFKILCFLQNIFCIIRNLMTVFSLNRTQPTAAVSILMLVWLP